MSALAMVDRLVTAEIERHRQALNDLARIRAALQPAAAEADAVLWWSYADLAKHWRTTKEAAKKRVKRLAERCPIERCSIRGRIYLSLLDLAAASPASVPMVAPQRPGCPGARVVVFGHPVAASLIVDRPMIATDPKLFLPPSSGETLRVAGERFEAEIAAREASLRGLDFAVCEPGPSPVPPSVQSTLAALAFAHRIVGISRMVAAARPVLPTIPHHKGLS